MTRRLVTLSAKLRVSVLDALHSVPRVNFISDNTPTVSNAPMRSYRSQASSNGRRIFGRLFLNDRVDCALVEGVAQVTVRRERRPSGGGSQENMATKA
jgi:hypothetical protein